MNLLRIIILVLLAPIMLIGAMYAVLIFSFTIGKQFTFNTLETIFPL